MFFLLETRASCFEQKYAPGWECMCCRFGALLLLFETGCIWPMQFRILKFLKTENTGKIIRPWLLQWSNFHLLVSTIKHYYRKKFISIFVILYVCYLYWTRGWYIWKSNVSTLNFRLFIELVNAQNGKFEKFRRNCEAIALKTCQLLRLLSHSLLH